MTPIEPFLVLGIFLALALAFVNGSNDAAHSIATIVATRSLSPAKAVFLTALCNMIGPFVFPVAVAATIGTAIITKNAITPLSLEVAMGTAFLLILVATRVGLPLSSSNAIVGGLLGACVAAFGISAVIFPSAGTLAAVFTYGAIGAITGGIVLGLITSALKGDIRLGIAIGAICGSALAAPVLMVAGVLKLTGILAVVLFIFISPIIGMLGAFILDIVVSHLFRHSRQNRMKRIFQPLHILACLTQATSHGGNDGQNAVGLITALLLASGALASFDVPVWVRLVAGIAIGLGTCFGGWSVVDKMAKEITKIRPYQGFCAATASSSILVMVTTFGIPVSSTHAINGAIVGVGATRGKDAVHWQTVRDMIKAWLITIPLAFAVAFMGYFVTTSIIAAI